MVYFKPSKAKTESLKTTDRQAGAFNRVQMKVYLLMTNMSGGTSTEFVYVVVAIILATALGAIVLGDDLGAFFKGFRFGNDGITFG